MSALLHLEFISNLFDFYAFPLFNASSGLSLLAFTCGYDSRGIYRSPGSPLDDAGTSDAHLRYKGVGSYV
jgi:hypothetical protein